MVGMVKESSGGGVGQVGRLCATEGKDCNQCLEPMEEAIGPPNWGHLFHHVLDGVKAAMTEHEEIVFLQCGRLVNRHWQQWAIRATTSLELATRQHLCKERLEHLVNLFTRLQHVTMMRAKDIDVSPLERLPLLRHLWIPGGLSDVTHLEHFTGLVDLDMAHFPLTYQDVTVMTALTRLTRLVVLLESVIVMRVWPALRSCLL